MGYGAGLMSTRERDFERFTKRQGLVQLLNGLNLYINTWCGWRGSNPRPLASEANTLSTELQPLL